MKVKGVSFSTYKMKLNTYVLEKLDLFAFLFMQIILDENLDKEMEIKTCLLELDIKEDLLYLFNNIYYKLLDNKIIEDKGFETIEGMKIKDFVFKERFIQYFKEGYFPLLDKQIEKEFSYDYLENRVVLKKEEFSESNLVTIIVNNEFSVLEELVNNHQKELLNLDKGFCILDKVVINPYYFYLDLEEVGDELVYKGKQKELVYDSLDKNSLCLNETNLKGEYFSSNSYFKVLYANKQMSDYCDYLFVYDKELAFNNEGNIFYLDYEFKDDFVDLVNKESYKFGVRKLENKKEIGVYQKEKNQEISDFKKYLLKNKDKFKGNINKVMELL